MRVPGVVFATHALIPDPASDRALEQVVNLAELPGIVEASYAMPDVHWGYGFRSAGSPPPMPTGAESSPRAESAPTSPAGSGRWPPTSAGRKCSRRWARWWTGWPR